MQQARLLGIYLHFPWCLRKCPYCDFTSFPVPGAGLDQRGYADAVIGELGHRARQLAGRRLGSVYIGGGTPSLWEPAEIGRVLAAVWATADEVAERVEVTVECNPSSLDAARAAALVSVGVNRLSVGVQSLAADRLAQLGRLHDRAQALAALAAARDAGVERLSADLIVGVATATGRQSPAEAADESRALARIGVGHLSAYLLTIAAGTTFGELARRGRLPRVSEQQQVGTYLAVRDALAAEGLEHYEISSFARPGQRAQHNLGVWRGDPYLGLGCAAWGMLTRADGTVARYRNRATPEGYLAAARAGDFRPEQIDELDPETLLRERIMLGLRTSEGLDLEAAAAELGVAPWPRARRRAAAALVDAGRLRRDGGRLRIPPDGWLFADAVAASLM